MKTRILDNLYDFGLDELPKKQEPLFNELCRDLSLSENELRQRARSVLKRILHNYSFFEVSTIDKFNHKIIKTFARDLRLSQNFEVELDTALLLEEAVGRLLERAGSEKEVTEVLIDFSLQKVDDDKSWNIAYDLTEIGKLLFEENHAMYIDPLRSKSIADFQEVQKRIIEQLGVIEAKVRESAERVLIEIENQGFDLADFPRQTLPNHFKRIIDGEFNPTKIYTSKTMEPNLVDGKLLKATDKRDVSGLAVFILEHYLAIKRLIYRHSFLKNSYGNIVPMTVLNEIAKEIKNIELERDIIPISAMNAILSREIKDQPVPFIYERMGEKYRHYFIDEFQDTSKMQWENLVPLIGNALESEDEKQERGSLFLVGDVKQAIYRWRGGRAEQLLDLLNGKSSPFVVAPSIHSLDTNWRSYDQIVEFNNSFFATVAPVLERETYRDLFLENSHQKTNNRPGGLVQLSFLEKDLDDKDEVYCERVLDTIHQIRLEGYPFSDICVLVRENKKGMLLANSLAQQNIPVISSDALLLKNNESVTFLISILRIFENQQDREAAYHILMYLSKGIMDRHRFISKNLDRVDVFLSQKYGFDMDRLKGESVYTILENAIVHFGLFNGSVAYISFLMDEVLDMEKREGPSVYAFLNHWEIKKESLTIAAPDDLDAIKIMTIHKAKGLEFPFVIFPFANAQLNKLGKKSWVKASKDEEELGLDELLINTRKDMLEYSDGAAAIYRDEEQKSILDAINVLYVALTRAEKGLYIFTEKGKEVDGTDTLNSYSELFQWHLQEQGVSKNEEGLYTFGSFPKNTGSPSKSIMETRHIPYLTRPTDNQSFTISTTSGRLWDDERLEAIEIGNLIHFALSRIKTAEDISPVVKDLQFSGHFSKDLAGTIEQKLMDVVTHPNLNIYFSEGAEIWNEQDILTVNGPSLRPDRIVISGNEATIIDYKTGKPSPSHKEQIMQYADALKEMEFEIKHSIIVYIDQKIEPIFI